MGELKGGVMKEGATMDDAMQSIRNLAAARALTTEMIETLHTALKYFDDLLAKAISIFEQDIQEEKWTRNQLWAKCFTWLNEHGHNRADDFRSKFVMDALDTVRVLPKDHALLRIGGFLPEALELQTYSQFYQKSDPKKRLAGVVAELNDLPEYVSNRKKLIRDIVFILHEKESTVQSAVQRYRKSPKSKKVQIPKR